MEGYEFQLEELQNMALYPMGNLTYCPCVICFEYCDIRIRVCCEAPICDGCLLLVITFKVNDGIVKVPCPNFGCNAFVNKDEIMTILSGDMKEKFSRFLVDANKDQFIKTCPRCSEVTQIDRKKSPNQKHGFRVKCVCCQLDWCFPCQAPWHEGLKCKEYRKGDKLLKKWAKEKCFGQTNAQKCPRCKTYIQRSTGCDHMVCTNCKTDFCYRCGDQYRSVRFVGDHHSRLSVLGCKYRLWPESPVQRRLVRGGIFAGGIMLLPVAGALVIAAGAGLLAASVVLLPVYAGIKFHRRRHQQLIRATMVEVSRARQQAQEIHTLRLIQHQQQQLRNDFIHEMRNDFPTRFLDNTEERPAEIWNVLRDEVQRDYWDSPYPLRIRRVASASAALHGLDVSSSTTDTDWSTVPADIAVISPAVQLTTPASVTHTIEEEQLPTAIPICAHNGDTRCALCDKQSDIFVENVEAAVDDNEAVTSQTKDESTETIESAEGKPETADGTIEKTAKTHSVMKAFIFCGRQTDDEHPTVAIQPSQELQQSSFILYI